MTPAVLASLSVAVALAAFVQGTIGVGFALIVAPILALLAPELVPASLLALMMPLNAYVAWRERHALDWKGARWITGGRVVGTLGGLWLLAALSASHLGALIGAATIVAAAATLASPSFAANRESYVAAGVITGIAETATGIGGPPLALVYQHQPAPVLRSTIALCFLLGEAVSLASLAVAGRVSISHVTGALLLMPALALGAASSRWVHHRVGGRYLRMSVLLFAIVSGAVLLARS